jgi:GNAT superfamily N-acetyltransferase
VVEPSGGDAVLHDWREIHNLIIPTDPLSVDEVRERASRNHLEVAYLDGVAVGNSTVRPPSDDPTLATVIARVLPEHRGRGFGDQIFQRCLAKARELGARQIETIVLESNTDVLRFASRHGFTESERYVLPGDTIPFVHLRQS